MSSAPPPGYGTSSCSVKIKMNSPRERLDESAHAYLWRLHTICLKIQQQFLTRQVRHREADIVALLGLV